MAADNLKIQQQINKLVADRAKMMRVISKETKDQLQLTLGLKEAMISGDIDAVIGTMKKFQEETTASIEKGTEAANKNSDAYNKVARAMSNARTPMEGLVAGAKAYLKQNKNMAIGLAATASAFKGTFALGKSLIKGTWGVVTSLVSGIFSVGKSILAIPFKLIGGLFKMASQGGGGTELRQAYEAVRKEFGSLKEGMGAIAIGASRQLQAGLAGTGLSARRVFGNMAEQIKAVQQLFTDMGPKLVSFTKELSGAGAGRIATFQKGLGLSADGLQAFAGAAKSAGTTLEQQLSEVNNLAQQLGPTFAGSAKMMARQMGTIKKMPQFIQYTNKELAEAVAYSSQLGVEAGKLAGVLDKFDSFDSAAESADALSQAFGANVDVMKIMQANTAADRTEMLRKSMAAAGKDAATMTRQQLKLLAAQTNMDEATAKSVFSLKNQGKSLEDIKKASKDAEKKPLSQAEAMGKLADSIERLVKGGGSMGDGFFGPLLKGFEHAIKMSGPFRKLMATLRQFRRLMYNVGRSLGRVFTTQKGFGKFINALTRTFKGVMGIFQKFNAEVNGKEGPEQAFINLKKRLSKFAKNFFKTDMWKDMKESMMSFLKLTVNFISKHIIPGLLKGVASMLEAVIGLIQNPGQLGLSSAGSAVAEMFRPLIEWFQGPEGKQTIKRITDGIKTLFNELKDRALPVLKEIGTKFGKLMALRFFGGAAINFAGAKGAEAIGGMVMKKLKGGGLIPPTVQDQMLGQLKKLASVPKPSAPPAIPQIPIGTASAAIKLSGMAKLTSLAGKVAIGAAVVTMVAGAMIIVGKGLSKLAELFNMTPAMAVTLAKTLGGIALALVPVGLVALGLGALGQMSALLLAIPVGALVVAAVGIAMVAFADFMIGILGTGINPTSTKKIYETLKPIGKLIIGISILAPLLGALGAIMIGSLGTGAVAITAGLATVSMIVVALAKMVKKVSGVLKSVSVAGLLKVEIAFKALAPIGDILGVFTKMLKQLRPSVASIFERGSMADRLKAAADMAVRIIKELKILIIDIIKVIKDIPMESGFAKKIGAVGSLIGAIANLAQAIQPPPEFYKATEGVGATNLGPALKGMQGYMSTTLNSLKDFAIEIVNKLVKPLLGTLKGISPDQLKGVSAIAGLLNSVASLAKALKPSPAFMKATAGFGNDDISDALPALGAHMSKMINIISKDLAPAISSFVTTLLPTIKSLGNDETVKGAKALAAFMNAIVSVMGALQPDPKLIKTLDSWHTDGFGKLQKILPKYIKAMLPVLDEVAKSMSKLFTEVAAKMPEITEEKLNAFQGMSKMFEMVKKFSSGTALAEEQQKIIPSYLSTVNKIVASLKSSRLEPQALKDIKKVVGEINAINDELKTVNGPTLGVALKNFAIAAKQEVGSMTLKRSNTTIKFGVSVTIDAKQLAQELAKTKINSGGAEKGFIMFNQDEAAGALNAHNHAVAKIDGDVHPDNK